MATPMDVFCPCREPRPLEQDKLPVLIGRDECYFAVSSLLFCPQCTSVRCPFCTESEPVSWYCSSCLMETTKQEARAASNRCMRNCMRCSRCHSNAILKPVEDDGVKKLAVECANPACGWKYAGLFSMPVKDAQPLSVAQQVRLLGEHAYRRVLGAVEAQISSRHGASKSADIIHAVPPHLHAGVSSADAGRELPELVPLRAKLAKKCRVCETLLVDPVRQPSQASFKLKTLARDILPCVEAYRVGSVVKLVLRNFGNADMDVQIASPDAETVVLAPRLLVPSLQTEGFAAPLFLVERETTGSRQAFMANASQKRGRGWAICELEVPPSQEEVRLFSSSAFAPAAAAAAAAASSPVHTDRIGAWIKARIVHLDPKIAT